MGRWRAMGEPDIESLGPTLRQTSEDIGRLAEDDAVFRAVVDAFRAQDGESFQRILGQLEVGLRCEEICRWIRSKECVRVCLELCGPPSEDVAGIDDIPAFAEIVA